MSDTTMTDAAFLELVHAEIDGELDAHRRSELARRLLADPTARAAHDDLRRLCAALDRLETIEPPPDLVQSVLAAVPQTVRWHPRRRPGSGASTMAWRYVAVAAGVLIVGTVALETLRSPRFAAGDGVGTMATADGSTLDAASLATGPVSGRVRLYRDRSGGLAIELDVTASAPVDALVTGNGHTLRVSGLGRAGTSASTRRTPLPGFGTGAGTVEVTFLMDGKRVSGATLRAGGH